MRRAAALALLAAAGSAEFARGDAWAHAARDATRRAVAPAAPLQLDHLAWIAPPAAEEEYIAAASPVVCGGRVFVHARIVVAGAHIANRLVALDAANGARLWSAELEPDVLESWSSPAVDARNGTVLVVPYRTLYALDAAGGAVRWTAGTGRYVVNASPLVTQDRTRGNVPANRCYIVDFGIGGAGLHAFNVDPFEASHNPFDPGQEVWARVIPGAAGNSAAYADGVVYISSTSGRVYALDPDTGAELWQVQPSAEGFYGGLTVAGGFVYVASYNFNGGQNNSRLFKLRAADGGLTWQIPCERTDSIPVVAEGRVYLAGGIHGFGSAVKLQAFADQGTSASLLWDTWVDSGGALLVGGWTLQPALARGRLYAGTLGTDADGGLYRDLRVLDAGAGPGDPAFVRATHAGAGGSPAIANGMMYSVGPAGLVAFDLGLRGDLNCDGVVNNFDIDAFVLALTDDSAYRAAYPECDAYLADVNRDGLVNNFDIDAFVALLTGAP